MPKKRQNELVIRFLARILIIKYNCFSTGNESNRCDCISTCSPCREPWRPSCPSRCVMPPSCINNSPRLFSPLSSYLHPCHPSYPLSPRSCFDPQPCISDCGPPYCSPSRDYQLITHFVDLVHNLFGVNQRKSNFLGSVKQFTKSEEFRKSACVLSEDNLSFFQAIPRKVLNQPNQKMKS